jgi:RNA polymerase sigma factor (sigma-70 family)
MNKATIGDLVYYLRKTWAAEGARELTDGQLLRLFLDQHEEIAFAVLVHRHGPMVLDVCRHVLGDSHGAEDAFQATFMVLCRRAGSIRRKGSVGSWLFGVAKRIARKDKARMNARRHKESRAMDKSKFTGALEPESRELRGILHEEIGRLPHKYSCPLILCYFAGKSYDQAAKELGWAKGTLASRLERARELLRQRLIRRGVSLGGAALATALGQQTAKAMVPALLTIHTTKAAAALANGGALASAGLSAAAVAMVEEALKAHVGLKATILLMVLTLGIAGGGGFAAYHAVAEKAPVAQTENAKTPQVQQDQAGPKKASPAVDLYGDPLPDGAITRMGTVRLRPGYGTNSLAFSPDGKVLASAGTEAMGICMWELPSGKPLARNLAPQLCRCVAYAPDGKILAVGTENKVTLMDSQTGRDVRDLKGKGGLYEGLAFSPDGKMLAAYNRETVSIWEMAEGKEVQSIDSSRGWSALAFSTDGKILAAANSSTIPGSGGINLWDIAGGRSLQRMERGHDAATVFLAFVLDGKTLVAAYDDGKVETLQVDGGKVLRQFRSGPLVAASSPEGRLLALRGQAGGPLVAATSPDGKLLAVAAKAGDIAIWDLATGQHLRQWHAHYHGTFVGFNNVSALAFDPEGKKLASTGTPDHAIRLWDAATGREIAPPSHHSSNIRFIRYSQDGKSIYSSDYFKILKWDTTTGADQIQFARQPLNSLDGDEVTNMEITPDGTVAAFTQQNRADELQDVNDVYLCDLASGNRLRTLRALDAKRYTNLKLAPSGKLLASRDLAHIRLWDVASGALKLTIKVPPGPRSGQGLSFSGDGSVLAFAGSNGTIVLSDIADGKELPGWDAALTTKASAIRCLAFAPDDQMILAHTYSAINVIKRATGEQLQQFHDADGGLTIDEVAFSPNGRVLAISQRRRLNKTGPYMRQSLVTLWEAYSGQQIREFDGEQGWIWALDFSPDGDVLATGGNDSTILLWDLKGPATGRKPLAGPITKEHLERLWSELNDHAAKAEEAIWALAAAPAQAVPMLEQRLLVAPAPKENTAKLLADLDSGSYAVRQKAAKDLEDLGDAAEAALRKHFAGKPSLEVHQRIEQILAKNSKAVIVKLRAIEALEHMGTSEACRVLRRLATELPNPWPAKNAAAALERLARK